MFWKCIFKPFKNTKISSGTDHYSAYGDIDILLASYAYFFHCKDEARVEPVNKTSFKFSILQASEKVKINKAYREEPVLDLSQS